MRARKLPVAQSLTNWTPAPFRGLAMPTVKVSPEANRAANSPPQRQPSQLLGSFNWTTVVNVVLPTGFGRLRRRGALPSVSLNGWNDALTVLAPNTLVPLISKVCDGIAVTPVAEAARPG